jgi:ribosomal protein L37E
MYYCRNCGTQIYDSKEIYCSDCKDDIVQRAKERIRDADEDERRRMRNDSDYAHSWLQSVIGWIIGLMNLLVNIFSGCYLTSAVVAFKGLGDSSPEMELMRRFRNDYILEGGVSDRLRDLEEYYIVGGALRNWVDSRSDAALVWEYVWRYVAQVVEYVKRGQFPEAYELFKNRTLALRWDVLGERHLRPEKQCP